MLKFLQLHNVGPTPKLQLDLAERLNLITGDNGLGKTFILDVAWWALTRRWPHDQNPRLTSGYPARPADPGKKAEISFEVVGKSGAVAYSSHFDSREQAWVGRPGRPWNPGLVIYAHADGGFSVWDPARNYWRTRGNADVQERLPCYVFAPGDVWDGLDVSNGGKNTRVCNGLIADWAGWLREAGETASVMRKVIGQLTPPGESFDVGPLVRISLDDARDIPSIRMAYAPAVPILHASSGIRRIVALAYMLLWSWKEHQIAAGLLGEAPTRQVVLLFDELEGHLHPKWQRTILGSLLRVTDSLHSDAAIQLIGATHSPLVLASAEPFFDQAKDAWFDLDLENRKIVLRNRPFVPRGDASNWLTSDAFDLATPLSVEAESAMELALSVLREKSPSRSKIMEADVALRAARLPDSDPFWAEWRIFTRKKQSPNDNAGEMFL